MATTTNNNNKRKWTDVAPSIRVEDNFIYCTGSPLEVPEFRSTLLRLNEHAIDIGNALGLRPYCINIFLDSLDDIDDVSAYLLQLNIKVPIKIII